MFPVHILILLGTVITLNQADGRENKSVAQCCQYPKQNDEFNDFDEKCKLLFNGTNQLTKTELEHKVACSVKCTLANRDLFEDDGETIKVADFRKILYKNAADDDVVVEFYNSKMEICQPKQDEYANYLAGNEECPMKNVGLLVCTIFETVTDCPASLKMQTAECDNYFRRLRFALESFRNRKVDLSTDLIVNSELSMKRNLL